jgi:glutathione S-transferase
MIEIFGVPASRARRVLWVAEECNADYTLTKIAPRSPESRSPEYRKINPNGRVPAMRDGALVLYESAAICLYIAEQHPEAQLLPKAGSSEAALHNQWMFWLLSELEQPLWTMGKHRFALPEEWRVPAIERTALHEFETLVQVLHDAVAGREFLVGDHFTVADVIAAHTLLWARSFKVPIPGEELHRYMDLHRARPAFAATKRWEDAS